MVHLIACLLFSQTVSMIVPEGTISQDSDFIRPPVSVTLVGGNGGHFFRVELQKKKFVLGTRVLSSSTDMSTNLVDGEAAYGSDWWEPKYFEDLEFCARFYSEELKRFDAWIDGEKIEVPVGLWNTCFQPNLGTEPDRFVFAWLSADGSRLVVKMLGSDAGGGYRVIWTIRKNGKHERKVTRGC